MRLGIRAAVAVCLYYLWAAPALGQIQNSEVPRYELGAEFGGAKLNGAVSGGGVGLGLHFGYNYNRFLSFEAEVRSQQGTSATDLANTFVGLFGPRVGYTSRIGGIYVNLRPGLIHFPPDAEVIAPVAKNPTRFAFDTGVEAIQYFQITRT